MAAAGDVEMQNEFAHLSSVVRGPNATFVVLVASDGHEFVLKKQFIEPSVQLVNMLASPYGVEVNEDSVNYVRLSQIPSLILRRLCEYLVYKVTYTNTAMEIPEFPIDTQIAVDLLLASNFLDC